MADMHSVAEKMRLWEPTTKIWMKIDPYYQQQKCRPMYLVSGGIRFKRIFAEVPWTGSVKRQWRCRERQFSACSLAFSETLEIRPALLYSDSPSSAFQWFHNTTNRLFLVKFCFLFSRRFGWFWLCGFRQIIAWKLIRKTYTASGANLRQGVCFLAM